MNPNVTLTFAGDESGDASFAFKKGASRYFVIAMIATEYPDKLRSRIQEIKKELSFPETYEFKFHKLTGKKKSNDIFYLISREEFFAWALIVDKSSLNDSFMLIPAREFYIYFITELIRQIPPEFQHNATLILDEFGGKANVATEARRLLRARNIDRHFKKIVSKDSVKEPLIQLADLVAGAISHRDSIHGTLLAEMIEPKMRDVIEYPYK